ncbi:hypothetical protein [Exiguobacterium sp. ZOR0005]|uniref:hypothetical protein n=1 Tax=Exiguobacterium sp. ZOR0005 TaxID=1339226 RepID=UPI0006484A98|nr:hypothetical protein [Exiguobacterium sp. ZOR0005]
MKIKAINFLKDYRIVSLLIMITLAVVAFIVWTVYSNSNWIGFWGSIIGSFLGVMGVFSTMRWDQQKREEERKQDIFLSNKEIYIELITTLKKSSISTIALDLNKLKRSRDWHSLNKHNKIQINKVLSEHCKINEDEGLESTLRTYIIENIDFEFTEEKPDRGRDGEDYFLKDYAIDGLLSVLFTRIKKDIEFVSDMEEILISQEDLQKTMSIYLGLSSFTKNSESIYDSLLDLFDSNIWKSYKEGREEMFQHIDNIKKELIVRLEEAHR